MKSVMKLVSIVFLMIILSVNISASSTIPELDRSEIQSLIDTNQIPDKFNVKNDYARCYQCNEKWELQNKTTYSYRFIRNNPSFSSKKIYKNETVTFCTSNNKGGVAAGVNFGGKNVSVSVSYSPSGSYTCRTSDPNKYSQGYRYARYTIFGNPVEYYYKVTTTTNTGKKHVRYQYIYDVQNENDVIKYDK